MKVPYKIVIEPQEYANYAAVIAPEKILQLPFSNLGQGSIPSRNWIFEHAISTGLKRHWILDDNINGFIRLNRNCKIFIATGAIFRIIEDFIDRYENVPMAGMNYDYLCVQTDELPPYYLNTRVYSCILLDNSYSFRWRGRYNEDTDLSLRILKAGYCTILVNAFLACKVPTLSMTGGNMEELYKGDGRLKMAQSLVDQHPDVTKITWKWNRWQHQVDYRPFKNNKLILKPGLQIPDKINENGLVLKKIDGSIFNMEEELKKEIK